MSQTPTAVSFGSAQLLVDRMPPSTAEQLLSAALAAGAARLDTAPSYGFGATEPLVARVAAAHPDTPVTTKVGLEPAPEPGRARAAAGRALRLLPPAGVARVRALLGRPGTLSQHAGPSGRFLTADVERSLTRSLRRLGRLDRVVLHEVHPDDVTDELLALLAHRRDLGDVGELGSATGAAVTPEVLRRGAGLLTVAHVSVDPYAPVLPALPGTTVVGHGALGAGGSALARVNASLAADPALAARWRDATTGTELAGRGGVATALLARAAAGPHPELLVATRHPDRVAGTVAAASGRTRARRRAGRPGRPAPAGPPPQQRPPIAMSHSAERQVPDQSGHRGDPWSTRGQQ